VEPPAFPLVTRDGTAPRASLFVLSVVDQMTALGARTYLRGGARGPSPPGFGPPVSTPPGKSCASEVAGAFHRSGRPVRAMVGARGPGRQVARRRGRRRRQGFTLATLRSMSTSPDRYCVRGSRQNLSALLGADRRESIGFGSAISRPGPRRYVPLRDPARGRLRTSHWAPLGDVVGHAPRRGRTAR